MEMLSRMYTCLPSLMSLAFIIFPVLMTAMKLDNKDIMTVNMADFGGEVLESDNGEPSYRILNKIDGSIYIGGNESLIRVFLDGSQKLKRMKTKLETTNATQELDLSCSVLNTQNNETVCWNFIRVVEKLSQPPNELLVCGTNAYDRLCYRCNITNLMKFNCTPGDVPRLDLVPRLPDTRPSSAVFGPEGTDSPDDVLFAALSGVDDPTLQKYKVPSAGDPDFELDTVTVGGRFIQKGVVFVGLPFEYTDLSSGHTYVFSFYREPAKEYENHGSKVYSRLSRVCKNDTGDSSGSNKLATFIKARVNCSIPDLLLPFHYDLIQDVIWKEDTQEVYAVFTSQELGPASSALCRYRMLDIMKLFDGGKFKDQEGVDPNKLWLPVNPEPEPRPGTCDHVHTTVYPPLLNELVPNYNPINPEPRVPTALLDTSALPTLYIDGIRLTSLAADFQGDKCIFFFGTTTGMILKAYKNVCSNSSETFKAVKLKFTSEGTDDLSINGLGLLDGTTDKVLVVSKGNEIMDWPINENCRLAHLESECSAVFGPYCTFSNESCGLGGGDEDSTNSVLVQPHNTSITACGMDKIILYCEADYGVFNTDSFTISWTKTNAADFINKNYHLVVLTELSPSLLAMEVTVIKDISDGDYTCSTTRLTSVKSKTVTVIHEGCLTEGSLQDRCDLHNKLDLESQKIKKDFDEGKTCSIDVQSCDTCPRGSTTP